MGFSVERALAERALASAERDDQVEPVFPPVARRFLRAREASRLTPDDVAARWGQPPSMYWDLEFHDDEAFEVISVQDLTTLAAILQVSVMHLLFGDEPSPPLPLTSYPEVIRRLRARMDAESMSVDHVSELAGWDVSEYLADPGKLADLPICGLRAVCNAAGVDWATTLNDAPR